MARRKRCPMCGRLGQVCTHVKDGAVTVIHDQDGPFVRDCCFIPGDKAAQFRAEGKLPKRSAHKEVAR